MPLQAVGVIGLGEDGARMARLMRAGGINFAGFDPDSATGIAFAKDCGIQSCQTLKELVSSVGHPRRLWIMPGSAACFDDLWPILEAEDMIVDCAVPQYQVAVRRSKQLADQGIKLIDAGVSGSSAHYALMLGGEAQAVEMLKPCLDAISPQRWLHCGPSGSGYFVKQVHKHIEQSVQQSLIQGLAALKSGVSFAVDLPAMAHLWQGSALDQAAIRRLVLDFLIEANVLPQIAANDPQELQRLRQQMTPALHLALALHYADQGSRLFQQRIAAMLAAAAQHRLD